jgi:hypothetical protein
MHQHGSRRFGGIPATRGRARASVARLAPLVLFVAQAAPAQTGVPSTPAAPPAASGTTRLDPVVVRGRDDSLVGIADSASQGTAWRLNPPRSTPAPT